MNHKEITHVGGRRGKEGPLDCSRGWLPASLEGPLTGAVFPDPARPPAILGDFQQRINDRKATDMYMPEISVRFEICQTDAQSLREWRVVLGGAVRGGVSAAHGYMPTSGPVLLDACEDILANIRSLLEAYAGAISGTQLELDYE